MEDPKTQPAVRDAGLARQVETLVRSRRSRANRHQLREGSVVFDPNAQPVVAATDGTKVINHHDVLVVPPAPDKVLEEGQFYRFPVNKVPKDGNVAGSFTALPEAMDLYDYQERAVHSIANPERWGARRDVPRGPAFATLPVRPEPAATSCGICYLVNTNNLNFINAWTAEEWNDTPGGVDLPAAPGADADTFEVLLAGPRGKVFRLWVGGVSAWQPGRRPTPQSAEGATYELECVALDGQTEIWNQLRNGCVAGRVLYEDEQNHTSRIVPLVNITTLTPADTREAADEWNPITQPGKQVSKSKQSGGSP